MKNSKIKLLFAGLIIAFGATAQAKSLIPAIYQGTWTSNDELENDMRVDAAGIDIDDATPMRFIVSSSSLKGERLFLKGKICSEVCSKDKVIWQITGLNSEGKRIKGKTLLTETDNDGMKFVYKFKSVKY